MNFKKIIKKLLHFYSGLFDIPPMRSIVFILSLICCCSTCGFKKCRKVRRQEAGTGGIELQNRPAGGGLWDGDEGQRDYQVHDVCLKCQV